MLGFEKFSSIKRQSCLLEDKNMAIENSKNGEDRAKMIEEADLLNEQISSLEKALGVSLEDILREYRKLDQERANSLIRETKVELSRYLTEGAIRESLKGGGIEFVKYVKRFIPKKTILVIASLVFMSITTVVYADKNDNGYDLTNRMYIAQNVLQQKEVREDDLIKLKGVLNITTQVYREGKKVNLIPLKKAIALVLGEDEKKLSQEDVEKLLNIIFDDFRYVGEEFNDLVAQELMKKAIWCSNVQMVVTKLEDLRPDYKISLDELISLAQYYAISQRNDKEQREYGVLYTQKSGEPEVQILESEAGTATSAFNNTYAHIGNLPKGVEVFHLHSHPVEFSFFSGADFISYFTSCPTKEDLNRFKAKMVEQSGVVWRLDFNMTENQFKSLKEQVDWYVKNILTGKHVSDFEKLFSIQWNNYFAQILFIPNMLDTYIVEAKNRGFGSDFVSFLTSIQEKIPDLFIFQQLGVSFGRRGTLHNQNQISQIQGVLDLYGIKVSAEVPRRLKK